MFFDKPELPSAIPFLNILFSLDSFHNGGVLLVINELANIVAFSESIE